MSARPRAREESRRDRQHAKLARLLRELHADGETSAEQAALEHLALLLREPEPAAEPAPAPAQVISLADRRRKETP